MSCMISGWPRAGASPARRAEPSPATTERVDLGLMSGDLSALARVGAATGPRSRGGGGGGALGWGGEAGGVGGVVAEAFGFVGQIEGGGVGGGGWGLLPT